MNPNKAGLFEGSFFQRGWGWGGWEVSLKNLGNIGNIDREGNRKY